MSCGIKKCGTEAKNMITIVDYRVSNLRSIAKALEVCGGNVCVSNKSEDIEKAERIVLPGVGAFVEGMKNLTDLGLVEVLSEQVLIKRKPFLGICLGMQLLAREGLEHGKHKGLNWLPATVKPFTLEDTILKVPHMGWNDVIPQSDSPLFSGLGMRTTFYFVHSYHMVCEEPEMITATCDHGGVFTAAIQKDNIFAVQFHPEKSQENGLQLLHNFLNWKI